MDDGELSIVDTEKSRQNRNQQKKFSSSGIRVLTALGANLLIYLTTYFEPSLATYSDGDVKKYVFYALIGVGFYICHGIIELYKQSRGESIEEDEAGIDAEFMGTYKYTTFQDQKWFIYVVSAAAGGLNVLVYLAFLAFIVK